MEKEKPVSSDTNVAATQSDVQVPCANVQTLNRDYHEKIDRLRQLLDELCSMRHPNYFADLKDIIIELKERLDFEELVKDLHIGDFEPKKNLPVSIGSARKIAEEARLLYNGGNSRKAYELTASLFAKDTLYKECVPIFVLLLVDLKKTNQLFSLAHKLVDRRPDWALSWYTVACYYFSIGNYVAAKRFLCRSTSTNESCCGYGWVLFGHVFSKESEHDQAMNCYLKASRLLPGRHEPLLYLGMEYAFAANASLANDFLKEAALLSRDNPRIIHERACVAFSLDRNYSEADRLFRKALRLICKAQENDDVMELLKRPIAEYWEPLINNMGHCCRKLNLFEEAIAFHRKSLILRPRQASTLSALGAVYICSGQLEPGMDSIHRALALKPNDPVTKLLLKCSLEAIDKISIWNQFIWGTNCKNNNNNINNNGQLMEEMTNNNNNNSNSQEDKDTLTIDKEPIVKLGRRRRSSNQNQGSNLRPVLCDLLNETTTAALDRSSLMMSSSNIEDVEMEMD